MKENIYSRLTNLSLFFLLFNNEFYFTGNKGDAMLFNTNITHRLNRKQNARIRDTITIYFTPGQHISNIFKNNEKIKKIKPNIQNLFKYKEN